MREKKHRKNHKFFTKNLPLQFNTTMTFKDLVILIRRQEPHTYENRLYFVSQENTGHVICDTQNNLFDIFLRNYLKFRLMKISHRTKRRAASVCEVIQSHKTIDLFFKYKLYAQGLNCLIIFYGKVV